MYVILLNGVDFKYFINRYNVYFMNLQTFIIQFKNEEKNPNDDFAKLRDVLKLKYPELNYTIHYIP